MGQTLKIPKGGLKVGDVITFEHPTFDKSATFEPVEGKDYRLHFCVIGGAVGQTVLTPAYDSKHQMEYWSVRGWRQVTMIQGKVMDNDKVMELVRASVTWRWKR